MYVCVQALICVHVCLSMCECTTLCTAFNGYMLLNIIETGWPLDTLHLMERSIGIAERGGAGGRSR